MPPGDVAYTLRCAFALVEAAAGAGRFTVNGVRTGDGETRGVNFAPDAPGGEEEWRRGGMRHAVGICGCEDGTAAGGGVGREGRAAGVGARRVAGACGTR